ncbi:hypothetical protein AGOR_G00133440 [Albula goreensis]|uniref:Uncharacterized protein n=1 Tax=Albula goreensis TaxID=1534307 RepID=A0A8T3DD41_9TELE|nr:hypothetical protein AGOR_G00133440 [Albula goreensis]
MPAWWLQQTTCSFSGPLCLPALSRPQSNRTPRLKVWRQRATQVWRTRGVRSRCRKGRFLLPFMAPPASRAPSPPSCGSSWGKRSHSSRWWCTAGCF